MKQRDVRLILVTLEVETDAALKSLKAKAAWTGCDPDSECAVWKIKKVEAKVLIP